MVSRRFWQNRITEAWLRHSVVSIVGVRGAGKTMVARAAAQAARASARDARQAAPADVLDCSAPATRELLARPEAFLDTLRGRTLLLDDVGRLANARELFWLAANRFPTVRILTTSTLPVGTGETDSPIAGGTFAASGAAGASGASVSAAAAVPGWPPTSGAAYQGWPAESAGGWPPVAASAGRIGSVWLTTMTLRDMTEFGVTDIRQRMLHGGLPELLLAAGPPSAAPVGAAIEGWFDSFWARDIQGAFRLECGAPFRRLFELLMAQSGGMFEAVRLAKACGASRTTVSNYLTVLETAFAMHIIRPYAEGGRSEILSAPKVYGFDTGFVCHYRGATTLRPADLGPLWEHLVLNELHAHVGRNAIRYWRTKHGSEVDFVLVRPGRPPAAVECCWSAGDFEPAGMRSFRGAYPCDANPGAASFVVTADTPDGGSFDRAYGPLRVTFVSARDLVRMYQSS